MAAEVSKQNETLYKIERVITLEANIDDMTPEHLSHCLGVLLCEGALDAWVTPIVMKKGRAAHTLHALCHPSDQDRILQTIFRHSSTLGVRITEVERAVLARKMIQVAYDDKNIVDVKVGYMGDEIVSVKAEFDQCQSISNEKSEPIRTIATVVEEKARKRFKQEFADTK